MKNKLIVVLVIIILIGGYLFLANDGNESNSTVNGSSEVGTKVGDFVPAFEATTLEGEFISANKLEGSVIVITSSAFWCATCIAEAQEFAQVFPNFFDKDVVFLTVDIDPRGTKELIDQFKKDTNTPWDYINTTGGADMIDKLKLSRFEITYVIDRKGVITYKDGKITSAAELTDAIQKSL